MTSVAEKQLTEKKKSDTAELISRYQAGEKDLAWAIILNNEKLVHFVLRRFTFGYTQGGYQEELITYDDLYQEGVLGLYEALSKYNPELGEFSSFAVQTIKRSVFGFLSDKGRLIRVPYGPQKAYRNVRKAELEYVHRFSREPSEVELAKYAKIPLDELRNLRVIFMGLKSLDAAIGSDESENIFLQDIIPDTTDYLEGPEREIVLKSLRSDLERMAEVAIDDDRTIEILFSYYDNLGKKLVKDIAQENQVTIGQLNRIVSDAVNKIAGRFLDELIEGYSDVFSSDIRRTREVDLKRKSIQRMIQNVAAVLIKPGDVITIVPESQRGSLDPVRAEVSLVSGRCISVKYPGINLATMTEDTFGKTIFFSDVIDFRTSDKKIVEIACRWDDL